jgi:adenine-specific DNA-methyltransferase
MPKIEITRTELVWPGKYDDDGTLKEVPRVSLPFQVIETVNESRATRESRKGGVQGTLFDVYEGKEGDTFEAGWRNKLIWGDNLLVIGSLLEKFAGKIDLIYIDPPFATGVDFSFDTEIGESGDEITKEQSSIEEKAYRDTWGGGVGSYLQMMYARLVLMRDLLSAEGTLYVHVDWRMVDFLRIVLDEIFGNDAYVACIRWKRQTSSGYKGLKRYGRAHDSILCYSRSSSFVFNTEYAPYSDSYVKSHYNQVDERGRRYRSHWLGTTTQETIAKYLESGRVVKRDDGKYEKRLYLDDQPGTPVDDVWTDVFPVNSQANEDTKYATQKPEALLERVIKVSSNPEQLVADFFCGSGTMLAVAEKLRRRWIGCDLGRWGIHVTRKRLLGIENCRPFEVLNLGKYERQYWQGVTFGEAKDKPLAEQALYEYLAFILRLYGAQPLAGMANLHGKKGKAMVHIGAVDAPVTIDEVNRALDECVHLRQGEVHLLGWEWEMGLAGSNNDVRKGGPMHEVAKQKGVKLLLLQIPREVMEQQAAAKGDVPFFELAFLEAEIKQSKKLAAQVVLKDFVIPNTELIPEEVRSKVKKWSDYIDYWAVDWDFQNDTFMQGWVAYRTRKERKLPLVSDAHTYAKAGRYRVLVKAIDIFGNDTSQAFDVEVK